MNLKQIDKWHKTSTGYLVFGLVEAILLYVVASLAISSGSLLEYIVAIVLLVGVFQNIFKLIGKAIHGSKHKTSKA